MKMLSSMLCLAVVAGCLGSGCLRSATAGEAAKIDRAIGKEPKYESDSPKYLLIVFGEKTQTRVWVVFDGEKVYMDLNANGDLTDAGEALRGSSIRNLTIDDTANKTKHTKLSLSKSSPRKGVPRCHISVDVNDAYRQYTFASLSGTTAKDARVVHFGGPLRISIYETKLQRGKDNDLNIAVITQYDGAEWVAVDHGQGVPKDVHPLAEITFPAKEPGGKPIKLKVPLTQRC